MHSRRYGRYGRNGRDGRNGRYGRYGRNGRNGRYGPDRHGGQPCMWASLIHVDGTGYYNRCETAGSSR